MPKKPTERRRPSEGAKAKAAGSRTSPQDRERIAQAVCAMVATTTKGLYAICKEVEGAPTAKTFWDWLTKDAGLRERYAQAKSMQQDLFAEEIVEIADECSRDTIETEDGTATPNHEWMARSKLRVDTRKWLMTKLAPKKYGDKQEIEHSGQMSHTHLTLEELTQRMEESRPKP